MSGRSTPAAAFLNKLWKLVNDPLTDELIRWSPKGRSFVITDQARFTQDLVPKYFKHNNIQSFIRQLNLYGFRKLSSVESGGLAPDKGEIEFFHPNFIRGEKELIDQIKRKSQNSRGVMTSERNQNLNSILTELQKVKSNQDSMKVQIKELKKENDILWKQYGNVRMKFSKQQKVIEKLVRFMITMMDRRKQLLTKKLLQLPLEGGSDSSSAGHRNTFKIQYEPKQLLSITGPEEPFGPVIHEVTMDKDEDSSVALDKIFQTYTDSAPFTTSDPLEDESNLAYGNIQSMNTMTNPKQEPVETYLLDDVEEGDDFSFNSNVVPSSLIITTSPLERVTTTVVTTEPRNEQNPNSGFSIVEDVNEMNSFQPIASNYTPSSIFSNSGIMTVQSPNGTMLQDTSPPLSPGIMDVVDPSLVSPNIIVALPKEQILQNKQPQQQLSSKMIFRKPSSSSYPNSNIGSKVVGNKNHSGKLSMGNSAISFPKQRRGKSEATIYNDKLVNKISNIYNLRNDFLGDIYQDNYEDISESNNSVSFSSPKGKKFDNKNEGKLTVQNYTGMPKQRQKSGKSVSEANILPNNNSITNLYATNSDSDHLYNEESNSDNYKVSLPTRSLSRDDLEQHVDEVQSTLDSLKEFLQSGNINVDSSTLLSLFENDDNPFIPISESEPSPSGIVGNEVSLYNPYPFDDDTEAEGINFSSLIGDDEEGEMYTSPTKKNKPLPELISKEEGFETPQPQQMGFNFRSN